MKNTVRSPSKDGLSDYCFVANTNRCTSPPNTPPSKGTTQNTHNWAIAQSP